MGNKVISIGAILCGVLLFLSVDAAQAHGSYRGGNGSAEDPYQIWTPQDWNVFTNEDPNTPSVYFILMADLDLAGIQMQPVCKPGRFQGVFDGQGHILRNVIIEPGDDRMGLFAWVGLGGQIRNLGLEQVKVGGYLFVGGLVGENDGTISNCYASATVSGAGEVGGLVGLNWGTITACHASGIVTASGSYGLGEVGGLVGSNAGTITDCYATSQVSTYGVDFVGGLVGFNQGTITACFATGAVRFYERYHFGVGGLVGWNVSYGSGRNGTIISCYATGSGGDGGLVGLNHGTITACYATGKAYPGGLVGRNDDVESTITACFWDTQTSERTSSAGGTGKTTAEMKTKTTFTSAGWNFGVNEPNDPAAVWTICEGTNYPRLRWQVPKTDWICPDGVAMEDLTYLAARWTANTPSGNGAADANGDGRVGLDDLALLAESWMK